MVFTFLLLPLSSFALRSSYFSSSGANNRSTKSSSTSAFDKLMMELHFVAKSGRVSCEKESKSAAVCLLCNCANEAGILNEDGQSSVNRVVFSRVKSENFPDTVCKVVWQKAQFSWTLGGKYKAYDSLGGAKLKECERSVEDSAKKELVEEPGKIFALNYYNPKIVTPKWRKDCGRQVHKDAGHVFFDECMPGKPNLYPKPLTESSIAYAI